jgi:hypothetical protein
VALKHAGGVASIRDLPLTKPRFHHHRCKTADLPTNIILILFVSKEGGRLARNHNANTWEGHRSMSILGVH